MSTSEDDSVRRAFHYLILPALLLPPPAASQSLLYRNYTTQDGLPDSRVAPIIQDRQGYLWFGTQAGLTRYDGKEFLTVGPARDIPGIFGRSILEDRSGAIWFAYSGFREGGVSRFWKGQINHLRCGRELSGSQVHQVAENGEGELWIVTDAGLHRLRFADSLRSAWTIDSRVDTLVRAVFASRRGSLYYFTRTAIMSVRGDSLVPIYTETDSTKEVHVRPSSFTEDPDGTIWCGGFRGGYRLRGERVLKLGSSSGVPERGIWCFRRDAEGNFYAGTMEGLYRVVESGEQVQLVKERSFGDAVVYSMCLDHEGNLWLASAPGLRRILRAAVVVGFRGEEFLSTAGIGAIRHRHDRNAVFLASRNAGLYVYHDDRIDQPIIPIPTRALTITDVAAPGESETWMGLWRAGALHLAGKKRTLFTEEQGLPSNSVHSLAHLRSGALLVGTALGLAMIPREGGVTPFKDSLLDRRTIFDLQGAGGDSVWAGTDEGPRVLAFRDDSLLSVRRLPAAGLDGEIVYAILIDSRRRIWFGTDGSGAVRYDGTSVSRVTAEDGLPSNRVFALAEDSIGNVWIGTASGLSSYDGTSLHNLLFDQGFGEIGMHGLLCDREGLLWVSNYPGVTRIRPAKMRSGRSPPPLYLTAVLLESTPLDTSQAAELPPDPAVITFRYAAVSFTDERNVRYRYKLEGFDREWSVPSASREVRYTHLPPGTYRFLVTARSGEGVWTGSPVGYTFTILPPLWARWWFIAGMAILLGGAIYAAYRYRLNRVLQLERTRNRIAMDLHDDLGSTLTRISVMTEVARRRVEHDPPGARESLVRIGDAARDLIESLGDIVWTVDPKHDDLQNVIRRIVQFGQELCEGRGIAFETELLASFDSVRLTPDQRRDIYLVFKEGINNLVRHSGATRARFRVQARGGTALLELLDDGSGIREQPGGTGHGLASLRERGERVGVGFSLGSDNGGGTRIALEIKTA